MIYSVFHLFHIYPVTFISFTNVHLFISCTKFNSFISSFISISFILQVTVHFIYIHHVWFCLNCIVFQPHCLFHFFNQSRLWKLGKILIRYIYTVYHLKLNFDGITSPCYFMRIPTWCQSKATEVEDSKLQSRFMLVVPVNIYESLTICYLLLHYG